MAWGRKGGRSGEQDEVKEKKPSALVRKDLQSNPPSLPPSLTLSLPQASRIHASFPLGIEFSSWQEI